MPVEAVRSGLAVCCNCRFLQLADVSREEELFLSTTTPTELPRQLTADEAALMSTKRPAATDKVKLSFPNFP